MPNTNATNLRKNLSEAEYNSLLETLYLLSVPGMKERLKEGLNATVDDCEDFGW